MWGTLEDVYRNKREYCSALWLVLFGGAEDGSLWYIVYWEEAGKQGREGCMKKTVSSEGLIRPEGKTGCIFEMSDDVQAHVHNQKTKSAFSSRYFQYSLNNIIDAENFSFLPDHYQRHASNTPWQFIVYQTLFTAWQRLNQSIWTNPKSSNSTRTQSTWNKQVVWQAASCKAQARTHGQSTTI